VVREVIEVDVSMDVLEQRSKDIAGQLRALGRKIANGDDSTLVVWVIAGQLACAHRPLRYHPRYGGSGRNLAADASPLVFEWADRIRAVGIRSILCLMHDKELGYYACLDLAASDLMAFYREAGFGVCRVPWEDPAHSKTDVAAIRRKLVQVRVQAFEAFDQLAKPVLLHCSAGEDRSSPVAAYIHYRRTGISDVST
jgi:hypothetical protein